MIRKLLIANRGEIACRIARSCKRLSIPAATVHSQADRRSLHVRMIGESIEIGEAAPSASYLNVGAILDAAHRTGSDAVHPGIGFLSEDAGFAATVEEAGLVFVGPRPETMRCFGDKAAAKREAQRAGIPVIDGSEGSSADPYEIERLLRRTRLPALLKAAAGGGGRGARVVRNLDGVGAVIASAMREAEASFGNPHLIVETFLDLARHIEVQVAGDGSGEVVHLFERECSLQRRFQKIVEEAPADRLPLELREQLRNDAVRLAARLDYRGLGTVEFLVTGNEYFFLECNPRLQVEHTVTEAVTGLDLVEWQLRIAAEGRLPSGQAEIRASGHAVQIRLCAEDPARGFVPATGRVLAVELPAGIRTDVGFERGTEITPHYDSMIGKLVAHAATRSGALDKLQAAIRDTSILGLQTNLEFLGDLVADPAVVAGTADTAYIDRDFLSAWTPRAPGRSLVAVAAALHLLKDAAQSECGIWSGDADLIAWRLGDGTDGIAAVPSFLVAWRDEERRISLGRGKPGNWLGIAVDGDRVSVRVTSLGGGRHLAELAAESFVVVAEIGRDAVHLMARGETFSFDVKPFLSLSASKSARGDGRVYSPLMGKVIKVNVKIGDQVKPPDVLIVEDSMKMEISVPAPCAGIVKSVFCAEGDLIERNVVIVEIEPQEPSV